MENSRLTANHAPGENLYRIIRAGFVLQDTSLRQWCIAHGVSPQNAASALRGGWRGPAASRLIRRMARAACVTLTKPTKEAANG